jgi:hypothetical protein
MSSLRSYSRRLFLGLSALAETHLYSKTFTKRRHILFLHFVNYLYDHGQLCNTCGRSCNIRLLKIFFNFSTSEHSARKLWNGLSLVLKINFLALF